MNKVHIISLICLLNLALNANASKLAGRGSRVNGNNTSTISPVLPNINKPNTSTISPVLPNTNKPNTSTISPVLPNTNKPNTSNISPVLPNINKPNTSISEIGLPPNSPINSPPSHIECFERGCAGGPTKITKPDGRIIWACSHCPGGNSCNNDGDCAAPSKCDAQGVCSNGGETNKCPLTAAEELNYIREATQKAYDELIATGYSPCSGMPGNILSTLTLNNVPAKKCHIINPLGNEEIQEECLELPGSKTCNFSLNLGYAENSIGLGHEFICVVDKSVPVEPREGPKCAFTIDFWATCKGKPKPEPVNNFQWNIKNATL